MTQEQRLFEARQREDSRPCQHGESTFEFLDRIGPSSYWDDVRDLLESWFRHHPDPEAVRKRLKSDFDATYWEMYVHEVFRRLGYDAEIERGGAKHRPDFTFTKDGETLVVECWSSATAGFDRTLQLRNGGLEWVEYKEERINKLAQELNDRVTSPARSVWLDDVVYADDHPSFTRISMDVQAWIDEKPRSEQRKEFSNAGWSFMLTAMRKCADEPFVAGYPCVAVDPSRPQEALFTGIRKKAKKSYLQNDQEQLVIAASFPSTFLSVDEMDAALYQPGGLWHGGSNGHVAAVIVGKHMKPMSVAWGLPTAWLRPGIAELPLPFKTARPVTDGLDWMDASTTPHDLFGLPHGWGESDPFPPAG
ncbi:hypothetical protein ACFL51_00845 [Myxococcota bacterium]